MLQLAAVVEQLPVEADQIETAAVVEQVLDWDLEDLATAALEAQYLYRHHVRPVVLVSVVEAALCLLRVVQVSVVKAALCLLRLVVLVPDLLGALLV